MTEIKKEKMVKKSQNNNYIQLVLPQNYFPVTSSNLIQEFI